MKTNWFLLQLGLDILLPLLTLYTKHTATHKPNSCKNTTLFDFLSSRLTALLCKCFVPLSGVTILLSLTVFSQIVADTMPATSDAVPLLGNPLKAT